MASHCLCIYLAFLHLSSSFPSGYGETPAFPPTSPPPPPPPPHFSPFKPSVAVIIGFLTTMFCMTFLLLLYAKHCKRGNGVDVTSNFRVRPTTAPKNSGIDQSVIELLPVFRFGSLRGQKEGLECAVCLSRFESAEVLRLLPKCKHAFHVECVDTWLDAHSTCPLCRCRLHPEDVLLVHNNNINTDLDVVPELGALRRVSGRHSTACEFLQVRSQEDTNRRSLDSCKTKKNKEGVGVGCLDRGRKDGLLLPETMEKRFEHRIIVSRGFSQRWSDMEPSDLLFLQSEMIIRSNRARNEGVDVGRNSSLIINEGIRSVSEITGLRRARDSMGHHRPDRQTQTAVLVSRWLAWISQSRPGQLPQ